MSNQKACLEIGGFRCLPCRSSNRGLTCPSLGAEFVKLGVHVLVMSSIQELLKNMPSFEGDEDLMRTARIHSSSEFEAPRTKICMSFLAGNCQNGNLCM